MRDLKDKVAVVTGAASGIGQATAVEFAGKGADVVVSDVNEAGLAETVSAIEAKGRKALALGMVNEICPDLESCYKRAWEIADLIMCTGSRVTRRITTQQLRKPWKEDIANELRNSFSSEMYVTATEHSPHEVNYWHWAHEEAELVRAAEKKGKVIRPRIDGGQEEDEIK